MNKFIITIITMVVLILMLMNSVRGQVFQAEDMVITGSHLIVGDSVVCLQVWNTVTFSLDLVGDVRLRIRAREDHAGNYFAELGINDSLIIDIDSEVWKIFEVKLWHDGGNVKFGFFNNYWMPPEDRNLWLDWVEAALVVDSLKDVVVSWTANSEGDLAGYKVYWGHKSRSYANVVDIGIDTSYIVSGLLDTSYFFAVTAYDIAANESNFSDEVSISLGVSVSDTVYYAGDYDEDGDVDFDDFMSFCYVYETVNVKFDLTGDGWVDFLDFMRFCYNYRKVGYLQS